MAIYNFAVPEHLELIHNIIKSKQTVLITWFDTSVKFVLRNHFHDRVSNSVCGFIDGNTKQEARTAILSSAQAVFATHSFISTGVKLDRFDNLIIIHGVSNAEGVSPEPSSKRKQLMDYLVQQYQGHRMRAGHDLEPVPAASSIKAAMRVIALGSGIITREHAQNTKHSWLQMLVLLHFFKYATPYPSYSAETKAAIKILFGQQMLVQDIEGTREFRDKVHTSAETDVVDEESPYNIYSVYKLTERGRVFVEAVLNLPLPTATWSMPT